MLERKRNRLGMGWKVAILLVSFVLLRVALLAYVSSARRDLPPAGGLADRPVSAPTAATADETEPQPQADFLSTIPGFALAQLHAPLTKQGFKRETIPNFPLVDEPPAKIGWIYRYSQRDGCDFEVMIHGDGPDAIKWTMDQCDTAQEAIPFLPRSSF